MNSSSLKRIAGSGLAIIGGFYVARGIGSRSLSPVLVGALCTYSGYRLIRSANEQIVFTDVSEERDVNASAPFAGITPFIVDTAQ